jgi:hypothetical protein
MSVSLLAGYQTDTRALERKLERSQSASSSTYIKIVGHCRVSGGFRFILL